MTLKSTLQGTTLQGHPNPREVEALHLQDGAAAADPKRRVGHGAQEDEGGAPVLEIKTRAKEEGDVQNLKKMIQQPRSPKRLSNRSR